MSAGDLLDSAPPDSLIHDVGRSVCSRRGLEWYGMEWYGMVVAAAVAVIVAVIVAQLGSARALSVSAKGLQRWCGAAQCGTV